LLRSSYFVLLRIVVFARKLPTMSAPSQDAAEKAIVVPEPGGTAKIENGITTTTETASSEKVATVEDAAEKPDDAANFMEMGPRLYLIIASLMLGVFCVALDNNIVAVAIPVITNEFRNLNHVGWYGSAYLLPGCGEFLSLYSLTL
jgi:hypothetical protein